MGRKRGSRNKIDAESMFGEEQEKTENIDYDVDEGEVEKKTVQEPKQDHEEELVSTFDAAQRLKTTELTIKLWVDHGHLQMRNGQIPVRSIKECRFHNRRFV